MLDEERLVSKGPGWKSWGYFERSSKEKFMGAATVWTKRRLCEVKMKELEIRRRWGSDIEGSVTFACAAGWPVIGSQIGGWFT